MSSVNDNEGIEATQHATDQQQGPRDELIVNGAKFLVDREALTENSTYFKRMFLNGQSRIDDAQLDLSIFKDVLKAFECVSKREVDPAVKSIDCCREQFISMVHKFDIDVLKDYCEERLETEDLPMIYKYRMAHTYSMSQLKSSFNNVYAWYSLKYQWFTNLEEYFLLDTKQRQSFRWWFYYRRALRYWNDYVALLDYIIRRADVELGPELTSFQLFLTKTFLYFLFYGPIVFLAFLLIMLYLNVLLTIVGLLYLFGLGRMLYELILLFERAEVDPVVNRWLNRFILIFALLLTFSFYMMPKTTLFMLLLFLPLVFSLSWIIAHLIKFFKRKRRRIRASINKFLKFDPRSMVTIYVNGSAVPANKKLLAAKSGYFREEIRLLTQNLISRIEIDDPGVNIWHFRTMIWCTLRRYKPKYHELERVIELAKRFDLPAAVDACALSMTRDADMPDLFKLRVAVRFQLYTLVSHFTRSLHPVSIGENFIRNAEEFQQMNVEVRELVMMSSRTWWLDNR